jgi:outer membrane immunogenic protein
VAFALPCNFANAGAPAPPPPPPSGPGPSGANSASASSFLIGGHGGYNWQQGSTVFGFETDLQSVQLNSSMNGGLTGSALFPLSPTDIAMTSGLVEWYGTLRGRVGYAAGPWLFYGTGGLAYGGVRLDSTFSTFGGLTTSATASQVRAGWVAGAGVEYLLRPNLSLTFNYQYVDLGRLNLASTTTLLTTFGPFSVGQTASMHAQFQAATVGISWHFTPAGGAAPWAGSYGGLQLGGAWGNDANATYSSSGELIRASDIRLKRDVILLGRRDDGLGIYSFKYLWSDAVHVGVMAQEVALIRHDAVARDPLSGYLAVDYGRLGLAAMALQ